MASNDNGRVGGRIRRYARVTTTMTGLAARMAGERYLGLEIDRRNMPPICARRLAG